MTAMPVDLTTLRLDRSRPLRDQIYPLVRGLILSGVIRPGEVIDEKNKCKTCNGKKVCKEKKILDAEIDKGAPNGQ